MKVRLVHTAVMCWEISDNCTNVIKFEVKQDMPGLTARGHGRLRMTEGPQVKFLRRKGVNECKRNKQWFLYARSKKGKP